MSGIEDKMPWELINTFIWYSRSHINAYNSSKGLKFGQWQTYNASRGIATYQIAMLIMLAENIPSTYYADMRIHGKESKFGSFMELTKGVHYDVYSHYEKQQIITPQLQCALMNLNVLDAITFEKNHRLNNYNIVFDPQEKAVNICAYDNNSGPCFFISRRNHLLRMQDVIQ
ncbi:MAG: hypothetical protein PHQ65_16185 [Bacteroidales bacterium]|nr:hypothetical protein [Bacteroidales bacterium]